MIKSLDFLVFLILPEVNRQQLRDLGLETAVPTAHMAWLVTRHQLANRAGLNVQRAIGR